MYCRVGTWAILVATSLLRCGAMCAVDTTSVQLILSRGYDLTGQVHVITGGDSGIGYGIAVALAQANARIIFLGHDMGKTEVAMRNITAVTGNDKLSAIPIDLMSFASVRSAVAALSKAAHRVDALICDAGLVRPIRPAITADGFESAIQTEYISHFYLVELLLPELRKTRGRVVHTSTTGIDSYVLCAKSGLPRGCSSIDSLSVVARRPNGNMSGVVDGNIFLALWMKTMHARALARREAGSGVSAYSFHPGVVATSNMDSFYAGYGGKVRFLHMCSTTDPHNPDKFLPGRQAACRKNPAWKHVADRCTFEPWYECMCSRPDGVPTSCPLSPEQGGLTGAYLAAAPKAELAHVVNGGFMVACNYTPVVYGDPYTEMVGQIGASAADDFVERFYRLSLSWIPGLGTKDSGGDGGEIPLVIYS